MERFLKAAYGEAMDLGERLLIWTLPDRRSTYHETVKSAVSRAKKASDAGRDVYVGVGLQPEGLSAQQRGSVADVRGTIGLWADIDVAGDAHAAKAYPETIEDAIEFAGSLGPKPSAIVHSGNGVHAWWFFSEPWVFEDDADRKAAITLCKRWSDTIKAAAANHRWMIDSVFDIARVLRVPGTLNHKTKPANPVTLIELKPLRYDVDDFDQVMVAEEYGGARASGMVGVAAVTLDRDTGAPHAAKLASEDAGFRKTWERKRSDLGDQSASAYDMAIANEGVYRGWTDQQIADAILSWRTTHGERPEKARRQDYITRTIGRSRAVMAADEAAEKIAAVGVTSGPAAKKRAAVLEHLSAVFQHKVIRWYRYEGEDPIHVLVLDPSIEIRIGTSSTVTSRIKFGNVLYGQGVQINLPAKASWQRIAGMLLNIVEVAENPEGRTDVRVRAWLASYLEMHPTSGPEDEEAIRHGSPILKGGRVYVSLAKFKKHVDLHIHEKVFEKSLAADLCVIGGRPERLGVQRSKRYWAVAVDDLDESFDAKTLGAPGAAWGRQKGAKDE